MRRAWLLCCIVAASGCSWFQKKDKAPDPVWERFNAEDDLVTIEVTATGTEPGPMLVEELHSSTGEVVVGRVTVDPGSGPVGTILRVSIEVDEDYAELVDRAEFEADSGERGVWTIDMDQDSADVGLWVRDVQSHGDEGEVRTDVFTVDLWHLNEDPTPTDAATAE